MAEEKGQMPHEAEAPGVADVGAAAPPAKEPDTPTTFLDNLSDSLKDTEGVDAELAGIISDHLLTVAPHADAVANAKTAIFALARERAAPATAEEAEAADG